MALLLVSCFFKQHQENFKWGAAISSPEPYLAGAAQVYFYEEGELLLNTSGSGSFGWARAGDEHFSNQKIALPDSVYVSYKGTSDKNETWWYEGGAKLPKETLLKIFRKNEFDARPSIIAGMAPGGRICIWVNKIEIMRFTVPAKNKVSNKPLYSPDKKKEKLEYLKHHPIDYTYWGKPDKMYDLDYGFCSENMGSKFRAMYTFSKEGIRELIVDAYTDSLKWNKPFGEKPDLRIMRSSYLQIGEENNYRMTLPVHLHTIWENSGGYYITEVVMPKDLPQRFEKPYINPETGQTAHYNRIVLGVEKDGKHAILWLDGPGKQEKIMSFKGYRNDIPDSNDGGYAKDVVYY